jgi:membrane-bound lytic murein transglycosylase MltF
VRRNSALAGVAVAAIGLTVACGRGGAPAEAPAPGPATSAAAPATPKTATPTDAAWDEAIRELLAPWKGDLDGMVERRYVRMLVTFSKTNYFLDQATQHGITYDAGKLFEDTLNAGRGSNAVRVNVAFIPVRRDDLLRALADGRGDIAAANLTITPDREQLVDFSVPFRTDAREILVTGANIAGPSSVEDLSGREVHVRRSSSYFESLTRLNASLMKAGKPPVKVVAADEQLEDEDLLEMVNAGLMPATIVDDYLATFWAQVFDHISVRDAIAVNDNGRIAWAVRKGSPQLKRAVDSFASTHGKGTLQANVVLNRYLKSTDFVRNSASAEEQHKFRTLVQIFQKYGGEYDLPWLLVAAQGYQESQLDQDRRSSAGAVGVMQIKPTTAAGAPLFIRDVDTSTENNIHAGVKYLRFIIDQYYKNEPMDGLNKGLFAIASYNAGPARISELRAKATRMGLDSNVWFQNVEVVAAREIGRETVQYVSNIYKYFVSYKLIVGEMEQRGELTPGGSKTDPKRR